MDCRKFLPALALGVAALALPLRAAQAQATVTLSDPDSNAVTDNNAGTLNLSPGSYTLWSLLAGASTGGGTNVSVSGGTDTTYGGTGGNILTNFTPTGDYLNNPILEDYVLATNGSGQQSLISLGEIDPQFAGSAASADDVISVTGSTADLEFLAGNGASGRDLTDVVSLQLLSVGASPATAGAESTAVTLTGASGNAGTYNLSGLENLAAENGGATTESVNSDNYTGLPLWTFLDPTDGNILNQYVLVTGTDGYEVVFSLAELDPSLGGNPADLLPYEDTTGAFPGDGLARVLTPSDSAHGRWVSNVDDIEIVPEPASLTLLLPALAPLALRRRKRRS